MPQYIKDFFQMLWGEIEELTWICEAEDIYCISLKSPDSHILIGPHGKNLEAITHILKLIISKKNSKNIHFHLEVNDYLEQKDLKLFQFIQSKIDIVRADKKNIILPFLNSYERKKVHSYVSKNWGNVYTQSQGEWEDRRIHLCYKNEKMTIDLESDLI